MKSIGFKNFRRFHNFPEMSLGKINLLVGGNNSGKSTLVKALLLCAENIITMANVDSKEQSIFARPKFNFDSKYYSGVKIKSFSRAITNNPAPGETELPAEVGFSFAYSDFKFEIIVAGDRESELANADVLYASIEDTKNHRKFEHDFRNSTMSFSILGDAEETTSIYKRLHDQYKAEKQKLEQASTMEDVDFAVITELNQRINNLESQIHDVIFANKEEIDWRRGVHGFDVEEEEDEKTSDYDYEELLSEMIATSSSENSRKTWTVKLKQFVLFSSANLFESIIENFVDIAALDDIPEDEKDFQNIIKQDLNVISVCQKHLEGKLRMLKRFKPQYLTAHAATQNALYSTADLNDYNAQTVHEYFNSKIRPGEAEYEFVTKWMKNFEIGSSFEVIPVAGEAYQVKIKDQKGYETLLSDKGMGSIQLMILLLKIASIIRRYYLKPALQDPNLKPGVYEYEDGNVWVVTEKDCKPRKAFWAPVVIIEEPEQNLHPKMQSKLAEFFKEVNEIYNCQFVIETHSEYLVRKTQVLVARENYVDEKDLADNNPFQVYYFNSDEEETPCYAMEYAVSGSFKNNFGHGFLDEAAEADMEIIRKEYELKKRRR